MDLLSTPEATLNRTLLPTAPPDITPDISPVTNPTPKNLTADRLEALLQMQKTDPSCKCISK